MQKLKFSYVDPATLQKNPWNVNIVSPENERKIEESLTQLGAFKPIIVRTMEDGSLQILGGEHRRDAAIRMRIENVPVVNVGAIDDVEAKKISLADNGRYGTDDSIALAKLLDELGTPEEIAQILPYSSDQLEQIFSSTTIDMSALEIDEDEIPVHSAEKPSLTAKVQTHQTLKFRVRIEDEHVVTKAIKRVMRNQGFTEDTEEVNAGDALVWLLKQLEEVT